MGFHYVVQHIISRIEETHGTDGKQGYIKILYDTFTQREVEEVEHHEYDITHEDVIQVKRYHIFSKEEREHHDGQPRAHHPPEGFAQLGIDIRQTGAEKPYSHQDKTGSHTYLGKVKKRLLTETDARHEIIDSRHPDKEKGTRHALTIAHEKEGEIDQGTSCLSLQHDESHRNKNNGGSHKEMAKLIEFQIEFAYQPGYTKGCAKLSKLCGLNAERTYLNPGHGPLDVACQEGGGKQENQETGIYDVTEGLVETFVNTQYQGA